MVLSQFYVLSPRGDSIISRDFRGDVPKGTSSIFFRNVKFWGGKHQDAPPVFNLDGVNYMYTMQNGLYFVMTSGRNLSASLALELLTRLSCVFKDYCGILSEESIRKNFVLIYELIDEMLDFGYPQTTSTEMLKAYVFNEPVSVRKKDHGMLSSFKIPDLNPKTTPCSSVDKPITMGGGASGKKQRNEIFVDIFERISVTFSSSGQALLSEIDGTIQMKSYLSGNPELRLALNEQLIIGKEPQHQQQYGTLVLDDCNFHECVCTDEFESQRTLTFVPPDGEFAVMNYRLTSEFRAPIRLLPFFEMVTPFKVELSIKVRADIPEQNYSSNLVISFPVPKATSSVSCDMGISVVGHSSEYVAKEHRVYWRIQKLSGGKEHTMRARIVLSSSHTEGVRKEIGPISASFDIPMYNVSNLQVRYLRIAEKSKAYNPYRWVRYVTRSGSYVCRV